jgi:hypothetical protein
MRRESKIEMGRLVQLVCKCANESSSMSLSDLRKFKPHEILAYVIVGLSPLIVGILGSLLLYPNVVNAYDYQKLILVAVVLPVVIELAFIGIALAAMYDEVEIALRARAAMLSGAVSFFVSGIIGLWSAWFSGQKTAVLACWAIGWLILGFAVRRQTIDLEAELEEWRAGRKPKKRSSHFYWTRREEIFKSLNPVDWESPPPK